MSSPEQTLYISVLYIQQSPSAWLLTGHIGIAVPDVYAACKLFEEQGVKFVKKPDDGKIKLISICVIMYVHVLHLC